jgi:hypothetical protein
MSTNKIFNLLLIFHCIPCITSHVKKCWRYFVEKLKDFTQYEINFTDLSVKTKESIIHLPKSVILPHKYANPIYGSSKTVKPCLLHVFSSIRNDRICNFDNSVNLYYHGFKRCIKIENEIIGINEVGLLYNILFVKGLAFTQEGNTIFTMAYLFRIIMSKYYFDSSLLTFPKHNNSMTTHGETILQNFIYKPKEFIIPKIKINEAKKPQKKKITNKKRTKKKSKNLSCENLLCRKKFIYNRVAKDYINNG